MPSDYEKRLYANGAKPKNIKKPEQLQALKEELVEAESIEEESKGKPTRKNNEPKG